MPRAMRLESMQRESTGKAQKIGNGAAAPLGALAGKAQPHKADSGVYHGAPALPAKKGSGKKKGPSKTNAAPFGRARRTK